MTYRALEICHAPPSLAIWLLLLLLLLLSGSSRHLLLLLLCQDLDLVLMHMQCVV